MAGHSKWANTKHRKASQDAKRAKIFTKIIRELVITTRLGGGDASSNPRLRAAIDRALANNMTRDTLNRAIARGLGQDESYHTESIMYEGYGLGGTAIMVECISNNRNRTVSDLRHIFAKYGGNLGTYGSVAYLFTKCGLISYAPGINESDLIDIALEVGVHDIKLHDNGSIDIYARHTTFYKIKNMLDTAGFRAKLTKMIMVPSIKINLNLEIAFKFLRFIKMLENFDDVQGVHHNAEISDEIMAKL